MSWSKGYFPPLVLIIVWLMPIIGSAQTTDITYQGKLVDNALPANASYDFEFRLYDALTSGTLLDTRTRLAVSVTNVIFTVQLDFPNALFNGANRWLEIAVKAAGGSSFTTLVPRQPLTSAPYAIRSLNSTTADLALNALQLGEINASQYVITTDARLADARNP